MSSSATSACLAKETFTKRAWIYGNIGKPVSLLVRGCDCGRHKSKRQDPEALYERTTENG